ncbi:hypothetical protein B0H14DRAFT_3517249 [Mycena olivaceomarginata]|nr:hypothetical protein B0H14DRAFT_3517249 [Mycena olivaceomarginata]
MPVCLHIMQNSVAFVLFTFVCARDANTFPFVSNVAEFLPLSYVLHSVRLYNPTDDEPLASDQPRPPGPSVFITALFASTFLHDDAGLAGLTITAALTFSESVYWAYRFWTALELALDSVKRIIEYTDLPHQPPDLIEYQRPPAYRPSSAANISPVSGLQDVSFELKAGEHPMTAQGALPSPATLLAPAAAPARPRLRAAPPLSRPRTSDEHLSNPVPRTPRPPEGLFLRERFQIESNAAPSALPPRRTVVTVKLPPLFHLQPRTRIHHCSALVNRIYPPRVLPAASRILPLLARPSLFICSTVLTLKIVAIFLL